MATLPPQIEKSASSTIDGVATAASTDRSESAAVEELRTMLKDADPHALLIFYSPRYDVHKLAQALRQAFPNAGISGCSTAGEISSLGMTNGGIVAIAFPRRRFRVLAEKIETVRNASVETTLDAVRRLLAHRRPDASANNTFAFLLIDGLCNVEEKIVAAVNWEIGNIPLVGGSSGDGLTFQGTNLLHNGWPIDDGAVLLLVETDVPFQVFKTQNFEPTSTKLVVTKADAERRIVYEINAEPAAREYAQAIGIVPDNLGPFTFASYPLVVRVGGEYYCRSIRNLNPDGSLTFFCAIDEGLVFRVGAPVDMVQSTHETLTGLKNTLGDLDAIVGFDCILRRLDAENRQLSGQLEKLYQKHGLVGFQTYGEQFNAMHLNQTLTGIAFGKFNAGNEC
jgi:hypothetical protein